MEKARAKCIMIVEDSPDLQLLLKQLLSDEGYQVWGVFNGKEALDSLRDPQREIPALILLDIMMPVMDGLIFRKLIAADPRFCAIPVVFMTADSHPETKIEKIYMIDFLRKPIDAQRLLEVVGRNLA